jgi:hypothetical protein
MACLDAHLYEIEYKLEIFINPIKPTEYVVNKKLINMEITMYGWWTNKTGTLKILSV